MSFRTLVSVLILCVALSLPASAQVYDVNKFVGTWTSNESKDFVFVKRLGITKEKDGKIKFAATLSGFPDDLYLGEAVGEKYAARNADVYRSYVANFTAGKISMILVINTGANSLTNLTVTSYLKYTDGSRPNVFFDGGLQKQPGESGTK